MALAIAIGTACGGGDARRGETALERDIRAAVGAAIDEPITAIACGAAACKVTVGGGVVDVPIAMRRDGRTTAWSIDGYVIGATALEAHVAALLADVGVAARVDCGVRAIVARPGDRVACALVSADGGAAWATLRDDGTVDVELALGAGVAAERSRDLDDSALDALSRELDRGDDGDDGDDGDEAPPPPGSDSGGP